MMPGGHDRHVVICFAGLGDPRSFYLEALGEPWVGLWCLWGGRGAPAAQIELFELPVQAGVHFWGVQGGSLQWVQLRQIPGKRALDRGRMIYQEQAVFYRRRAKTLRQNS